jgi:hypothetical protein
MGIDLDAVKRSVVDLGNKLKNQINETYVDAVEGRIGSESGRRRVSSHAARHGRRKTNPVGEESMQLQRPPRPREYLRYSWQHNLRDGLIGIAGGAALGAFLYFFGQAVITSPVIPSIEARWEIQGLPQLISLVWLVAAIPIVKGIAQLLYAALFAESIKTLAERFAPPQPVIQQIAPPSHDTRSIAEPPASVTEQTTNILGKDSKEENVLGMEGVKAQN